MTCQALMYALTQDWSPEDINLEEMFDDIDAEVDRLIVLEGFNMPCQKIPFFNLRDDEDVSSEESIEEEDFLCSHGFHRKSRLPITGQFSAMAVEIKSGKGLAWLRRSFMERTERKRIYQLYRQGPHPFSPNFRRSSNSREPSISLEIVKGEEQGKFLDRMDGTLFGGVDTKPAKGITDGKPLETPSEDDLNSPSSPKVNNDHDRNIEDAYLMAKLGELKERLNINIQLIQCNQFEVDFGNVLVGDMKNTKLMVYNGSALPVTFKIDKTFAKSKGFEIQPDKVMVLMDPTNDKGVELSIAYQTLSPKASIGPVEAWTQLHVKEVLIPFGM